MVVEFGLILFIGLFNPVVATYQLQQLPGDRVARALSAWSVSSSLVIAGMTALWGGLATITSPRIMIAVSGVLLLATPLLLPGVLSWRGRRAGQQAAADAQGTAGHLAAAGTTGPDR